MTLASSATVSTAVVAAAAAKRFAVDYNAVGIAVSVVFLCIGAIFAIRESNSAIVKQFCEDNSAIATGFKNDIKQFREDTQNDRRLLVFAISGPHHMRQAIFADPREVKDVRGLHWRTEIIISHSVGQSTYGGGPPGGQLRRRIVARAREVRAREESLQRSRPFCNTGRSLRAAA